MKDGWQSLKEVGKVLPQEITFAMLGEEGELTVVQFRALGQGW